MEETRAGRITWHEVEKWVACRDTLGAQGLIAMHTAPWMLSEGLPLIDRIGALVSGSANGGALSVESRDILCEHTSRTWLSLPGVVHFSILSVFSMYMSLAVRGFGLPNGD